ncbi:MAG: winged helix-turn-helix transcriptional regulator [Gammaproteobacteria bacterium]|nr:winged helix-turn-helix transcriptional regulator [Gammaproteobacteria bacterium]
MKENFVLKLHDLVGEDTAFGNSEGRDVYQKLLAVLDQHPNKNVVGISLSGISRTDASFPRESVISLAKTKRGEKGFYLQDFVSRDLMDNWNYAAIAKDQPIIVFTDDGYELLGDDISPGSKELLDIIMKNKTVTTSKIAIELGVSAQNASAKLKKLLSMGLILGSKQTAESGGVEFIYTAIGKN